MYKLYKHFKQSLKPTLIDFLFFRTFADERKLART
jgi:hypothetical protein